MRPCRSIVQWHLACCAAPLSDQCASRQHMHVCGTSARELQGKFHRLLADKADTIMCLHAPLTLMCSHGVFSHPWHADLHLGLHYAVYVHIYIYQSPAGVYWLTRQLP